MIDISQSMAGAKLERIKSEIKKYAEPILRKGKQKLRTILFDHKNVVIEEADYQKYCEEIDEYCCPGAGSSFSQPLQNLLELLQNGLVKELNAIFITDGYDQTSDDTTDILIDKIK